jgi:DNA-binding MurR/RpiR family transcriptional regulator
MFRQRIKTEYADLSPSFQKLGDYLMDHPYEAAFMTATQLGKQLDVDTATVVRFAQKLGYPGYPELLSEVQAEVREQFSRHFQQETAGDDAADVFRASVRQSVSNIEQFNLAMDGQVLQRVLDMIEASKHILVAGEGLSRSLAHLLAYWLRIFGYNSEPLPTEASVAANVLRSLGPKDLIIAIAVSRYCPDVTSVMQVAHGLDIQTISLVGAQSWPVSRASNVTILCPNTNPMKMESVTATAAAIDALVQALFSIRHGELAGEMIGFVDMLQRLTEARSDFTVEPPMASPENAPSDSATPDV